MTVAADATGPSVRSLTDSVRGVVPSRPYIRRPAPHALSRRTGFRGRRLWAFAAASAWFLVPVASSAQGKEDIAAAWGGGALGAYSGATLGLVAGLPPCNLTVRGTRCARFATVLGALVGSGSGAVLSYHDPDALHDRIRGAGFGALAGVALGVGLKRAVRQVDARDVGAVAAVGAALGTAPVGAGVGLGVGIIVGSALWLAVPGYGLPEAAAIGVVALAIGGLLDWAHAAAAADGGSGPFVAQLRVAF